MNRIYFAHAGHEHQNESTTISDPDTLATVGVAVVAVAAVVIGVMIYDKRRKKKPASQVGVQEKSDT